MRLHVVTYCITLLVASSHPYLLQHWVTVILERIKENRSRKETNATSFAYVVCVVCVLACVRGSRTEQIGCSLALAACTRIVSHPFARRTHTPKDLARTDCDSSYVPGFGWNPRVSSLQCHVRHLDSSRHAHPNGTKGNPRSSIASKRPLH